jgi:hypothetical protein
VFQVLVCCIVGAACSICVFSYLYLYVLGCCCLLLLYIFKFLFIMFISSYYRQAPSDDIYIARKKVSLLLIGRCALLYVNDLRTAF